MNATVRGVATVLPATLAALACVTGLAPAVANAAECGPGTVFDAPSNMCVAAPASAGWDAAPPPPAPAPPPSVLPPGMAPVQICPPIPFVAICFPVN